MEPAPHEDHPLVQELPSQVADYRLNPALELQVSESRRIGDGHSFVMPGVCDQSQRLLVSAERGHGTARHQVGWYSHDSNDVGVARYDWTDGETFGDFADGYLQDVVCLTGPPDRSLQLSGGTATLWTVRNGERASTGTMLVVIGNGTILNVSCDWGDATACLTFASALLDALS